MEHTIKIKTYPLAEYTADEWVLAFQAQQIQPGLGATQTKVSSFERIVQGIDTILNDELHPSDRSLFPTYSQMLDRSETDISLHSDYETVQGDGEGLEIGTHHLSIAHGYLSETNTYVATWIVVKYIDFEPTLELHFSFNKRGLSENAPA